MDTEDEGTETAAFSAEALDHWRSWAGRGDSVLDESQPWALPVVAHVEKVIPDGVPAPDHLSTVHAAALAVAMMLTQPSSAPGGEWYPALERWRAGRIRKVTRRARGIRWREAEAEPGVTVRVGGAEVRVLPAYPVEDPPLWLKKMQVGGLDLERGPERESAVLPAGSTAPVLSILLTPDVTMTTGKAAAQAGHAVQLAMELLDRDLVVSWASAGFAIRVVDNFRVVDRADSRWKRACAGEIPAAIVRDGGLTEVAPGTYTAIATFAPDSERS